MTILPPTKEFTQACKDAEFFETDEWAARRILDVELCTRNIVDPCAGRGVLGQAAFEKGYIAHEYDLNDWPDKKRGAGIKTGFDYLAPFEQVSVPIWKRLGGQEFTVFMNPPFSKTVEFVERSMELGARKIIMFQRMAYLESSVRREFFEENAPTRVWICGDRATCWRGDIPAEDVVDEDGNVVKGRKGRSAPTPHAFFIWEQGHRGATVLNHLYKEA